MDWGLDGAGVVGILGVEFDHERLGQQPLGHNSHRVGHADQPGADQDLKALVAQLAVGRQILALDVGVDRHLCNFASTGRADEVDRHRAALLLQYPASLVSNLDLHSTTVVIKSERMRSETPLTQIARKASDPKRAIPSVRQPNSTKGV